MECKDGQRQRALCVVGPTACHKTEVGVALAKRFCGEVVSADSVQVYRGMDIGSAKPTRVEQDGVVHHMIDCVPIDAPAFSVSQYRNMAASAMDAVLSRGHLPVVVGGSGLYVQALFSPLDFAVPKDVAIRARLAEAYQQSPEAVYAQLVDCDPDTAKRLHPNDGKRIVRALEVYQISGKPLSAYGNEFAKRSVSDAPYDVVWVGLNMDREQLYQRINQRVERMMDTGLLEEAACIYHAGYSQTLPAMQSIGYRQLFAYFDGNCTLDAAVKQIQQDTRNFAKRQLTWFRRDQRIEWFDVTEFDNAVLQRIFEFVQERIVSC